MEKRAACHQHTAAELLVRRSEPIAWSSRGPVGHQFDRLRWCLSRGRRSDHTRIVGAPEICESGQYAHTRDGGSA